MRLITRLRNLVAFYTILLLVGVLSPSWAGDLRHGKTIAQRWCAACHVVVPEQSAAWADAPSFSDIARRRADKEALARFLIDPHPPMPDMHLSRQEIDDIVSYIRSLDPRPAPSSDPEEKDTLGPKRG
ncbi:MAG: cytochrome c [Methylocystaceae bacterium]|jgi:mono/diheme cytochrome c family protein|nr:cytochrome c [Methylocystaceae bacterium]NBT22987.1 cytochrome c [Methylocystaceae bacterium]